MGSALAASAPVASAPGGADLAVTEFREAAEAADGSGPLVYAVAVDNLGDAPAGEATLSIALPPATDFVSVTPTRDCRFAAAERVIVCAWRDLPRIGPTRRPPMRCVSR